MYIPQNLSMRYIKRKFSQSNNLLLFHLLFYNESDRNPWTSYIFRFTFNLWVDAKCHTFITHISNVLNLALLCHLCGIIIARHEVLLDQKI